MDIFRGLKFSPNAEIGENSHFRMDTIYSGRSSGSTQTMCSLLMKRVLLLAVP